MKSIKSILLVVITLISISSVQELRAQYTPERYQLSTESANTDTTASASTNDTSDYRWDIIKPIGNENDYEIVGEVKQNGYIHHFKLNYPDAISIRTRYLASDSSGYVQVYTLFGWTDIPIFRPGTTATEGDAKIPFTLKTGSAIWAFRLARKF